MLLGLDLQGGVHFLMQVDQQAALDKRFEATAEDVRVLLRDNRVRYTSVERRPDNSIVATLAANADPAKARDLIAKQLPTLQPLDSAWPNQVAVRIPQAELDKVASEAIEQNVSTLRNRINELGVAEPIIQRQGTDRIVVQLPGVQDTAQAKRILGATATLEYRGVLEGSIDDALDSGNVPPDARLYYRASGRDGKPMSGAAEQARDRLGRPAGRRAVHAFDRTTARPAVSVTLNGAGGQRMFDFTSENVGKPMAVVYIERIPEVQHRRRQGSAQHPRQGRSDLGRHHPRRVRQELPDHRPGQPEGSRRPRAAAARRFAGRADGLRRGAHRRPEPGRGERRARPDGGAVLVRASRWCSSSSTTACSASITCVALLLNLLMVVAVMSMLGATLTLPGLAGIALTVGMSVDANVLINERIREELRAGMPPLARDRRPATTRRPAPSPTPTSPRCSPASRCSPSAPARSRASRSR